MKHLTLVLAASWFSWSCATVVEDEAFQDDVDRGEDSAAGEGAGSGGSPSTGGGFTTGGSATSSGGSTGSGGGLVGNSGGDSSASGGASTGGTSSGGTSTGGSASGGSASGGTSTGGGTMVGSGDCSGTQLWSSGAGTKYAQDELVVATCNGGTTCTQATPPGVDGLQYEFTCVNQYNCGTQDPGTTNWTDSPWEMTRACE